MKPATPLILATCGLALGGIFVAARGQHRTPAHKPAPLAAVPKPAFGDDDYIGSLLYFTRERAYPGASIDWSMYREAETTMHSDVLVPPGPTWKFLGPNNLDSPTNTSDRYQGPRTLAGRVNTAAFGRGTSIFVGSPTGGFWIGSFGSSAYTEESDGTWPTLAVSCCAVDSSGQGVYVGTGDFAGCRPSPPGPAGVMVTQDGGSTWKNYAKDTFNGRSVSKIAIDNDTNTLLATTGRTSGGGIDPTRDFQALGNLWISTDRGQTWAQAPGTPNAVWNSCAISQISATTGLRYYYAVCWIPGTGAQMWRSVDRGKTWQQTPMNPFAAAVQMSLDVACSPTNSNAVYVLSGADMRIQQSLNGGRTWVDITGNFPADGNAGGANYIWSLAYYCTSLSVTTITQGGNQVDEVFAALVDICSAVPNAGATNWNWIGHSYDGAAGSRRTHNDDHCIVFNPKNPAQGLFGNDGGLYNVTLNAAGVATLAPQNDALRIAEFYNMSFLPDEQVGGQSYYLGGCQDISGPYFKSGKAGFLSTWNNGYNLGDAGYTAIDPRNTKNQFLCGYWDSTNAVIYCARTTDTWATGSRIDAAIGGDRAAFIPPMVRSPRTGYLYLGTNHVWRFTGATPWVNFSNATEPIRMGSATDYVRSLAVSTDGAYLYTGSLEGSVWVNLPNFAWAEIDQAGGGAGTVGLPNRPVTSVLIDPLNFKRIWVTLSGAPGAGRVFRCDDATAGAARTWVNVSGNLPDIPACCIAVNPRQPNHKDLYVGTDMGVYFSNNSGGAWTTATIPYFLPVVSVRSIDYRFSQFTSYLSITTFGRGAWSITPPLTPSRAP